jgi:peptide/nickel transport system substrate-binding protein
MKEIENLEKMLRENKLTRRQFITAAAALGVSTVLPTNLMTGKAWATTPKKGGTFKMGVSKGSTNDSSDPALIVAAYMQSVMWGQTHNNLTEIDENGKLVPELAKSWEASKDAKTWRFELKKGVEFHNGKTMDAEDVIYSINWHRGEKSKSAAKSLFNDLKSIKADGKYTVIFELEGGNADFPVYLSDYHVLIEPNGSKFDSFNGTGGYIMKEFEPGVMTIRVCPFR